FSGTGSARDAAGFIGAIAAWPISRGVSRLGAAIIWGGVTVLGVLIFTGTPLSAAWARLRELSAAADDEEEEEPGPAKRDRRGRPGAEGPPGPDRHLVRGRGGGRHQGEQGARAGR